MYEALADFIVIAHLAYAAFVGFGLLAIIVGVYFRWEWTRNFWFRVIHLLAMGVVALEAVVGIPCPLTVWEQKLRSAAGESTYSGSFLGNVAHDVLFIDAPEWAFTVAYVLVFVAIVWTFVAAPPRWPRRHKNAPANPP